MIVSACCLESIENSEWGEEARLLLLLLLVLCFEPTVKLFFILFFYGQPLRFPSSTNSWLAQFVSTRRSTQLGAKTIVLLPIHLKRAECSLPSHSSQQPAFSHQQAFRVATRRLFDNTSHLLCCFKPETSANDTAGRLLKLSGWQQALWLFLATYYCVLVVVVVVVVAASSRAKGRKFRLAPVQAQSESFRIYRSFARSHSLRRNTS